LPRPQHTSSVHNGRGAEVGSPPTPGTLRAFQQRSSGVDGSRARLASDFRADRVKVFIPNERKEKRVEQRVTGRRVWLDAVEIGTVDDSEIEQALDVASCGVAGGRVEQEWSASGGGLVSPPDPNKGDS
jgi:hypothetical protein